MTSPSVLVDFCGEQHRATATHPVTIGREGDVAIDDNPYLHRRFLVVERSGDLWWLANTGSRLSVTVADPDGLMQAWLGPGARLPLVFDHTMAWFTAGPTTYEMSLHHSEALFAPVGSPANVGGVTTMGRITLTADQRLMLLALAEPVLRRGERGQGALPTNAAAARRLDWTLTKFNRKVDNVCDRLDKHGVQGLHGEPGDLAAGRRARLVEYAVATRLLNAADLRLLDERRDRPPD